MSTAIVRFAMGREDSPSERHDPPTPARENPEVQPLGDPWVAFGRLVAGVLVYGAVGWALDRWWDTDFLVVVGILLGAGLGLLATWKSVKVSPPEDSG